MVGGERGRIKETGRCCLLVGMDARWRALQALDRAEYVRFRKVLASVVGNEEAAHDVVQETFARALRFRDQWKGRGSLAGWVWRIGIRTALEQRRRVGSVELTRFP